MYAVVRTYSGEGASAVFDVIAEREQDVHDLLSGVPGFVSYAALRNNGGGVTMTVCEDKAGADESSRRAAEFVAENVDARPDAPEITEGETILQFSA
jgi:hypothetical protein